MIVNIERKLEKQYFEKAKEWDRHVEQFHRLVKKLESYKKLLSAEEKA